MSLEQKHQHWLDADDNEFYASELRTAAAVYIAALEAALADQTSDLADEVIMARRLERTEFRRDELLKEADESKATIERLKCCAQCVSWSLSDICDHNEEYREAADRCVFTPSRWTARAEEGSEDE